MGKNKLVVLGGGESGLGAAVLGIKQGYEVFVSDNGTIKDEFKSVLTGRGIRFEENKHSEDIILSAGLVIKSPGIHDKAPIVSKLKEMKIHVI